MTNKLVHEEQTETLLALVHEYFSVFIEWSFHNNLGQDAPFLGNFHIEAIAHALEQCFIGACHRLLIIVPPRYLKSFCTTTCFPAWLLGRDPTKKIMCVSYGDKPTVEFATGTRNLMMAPDYQLAFPDTRFADNSPIDMLRTTAGGHRMATSVSGAATGFGCDFLIVDDLTKAGSPPMTWP